MPHVSRIELHPAVKGHPSFTGFLGLAADGTGGVWLTAQRSSEWIVWHYNGGTWSEGPHGVGAAGPIRMLSATEGWAILAGQTLWHYHAGTWTPGE